MHRFLKTLVIPLAVLLAACSSQSGSDDSGKTAAFEESSPADETGGGKTLNLMDFATVGTCDGEFEGYFDEKVQDYDLVVSATVRVKIEDCRITAITIIDTANVHPTAAELIPRRIIESQSLPVEAVSGASVASWTLMTATAVALGVDLIELEDLTGDEY